MFRRLRAILKRVFGSSSDRTATITVTHDGIVQGRVVVTLDAPSQSTVTYLAGFNPGSGLDHAHGSVDVTAWEDAQQKTGTFARVVKLFDSGSGYPDFPSVWGGQAKALADSNGGTPLKPLYAFDNVPSASVIEGFLNSLPAGQTAGFIFQSEVEGSSMTGVTFLSQFAQCRTALNQALSATGKASADFPLGTSAYPAYYATAPSTAYIPEGADFLGADFYQHIVTGGKYRVGAQSDSRFQNWLTSVQEVYGTDAPVAFTEYGIGLGSYNATDEQARADLMLKDLAYVQSLPSFVFWMYWYQHDASPDFYEFPLISGETVAQAGPTIDAWQQVVGAVPMPTPPSAAYTVSAVPSGPTAPSDGWQVAFADAFNPADTLTDRWYPNRPLSGYGVNSDVIGFNSNEVACFNSSQVAVVPGTGCVLTSKCIKASRGFSNPTASNAAYRSGCITTKPLGIPNGFQWKPTIGSVIAIEIVVKWPSIGGSDLGWWTYASYPGGSQEIDFFEQWHYGNSSAGGVDRAGVGVWFGAGTNGGAFRQSRVYRSTDNPGFSPTTDGKLHRWTQVYDGTTQTMGTWVDGAPIQVENDNNNYVVGSSAAAIPWPSNWNPAAWEYLMLSFAMRDIGGAVVPPYTLGDTDTAIMKSVAVYVNGSAALSGCTQNSQIAPGTTIS